MWECPKCHERHEDSFEVCWKCGTSRTGVEDPDFQTADQIDPAALVPPAGPPMEDLDPATPWAAISNAGRAAYEFGPEQNEVIAGLAFNMNLVGFVSLIGGALLVVAGCLVIGKGGASALIQGVVGLVVGWYTLQAAGAFRQIVDSREDDIGHLMTALRALRSLYRLQVVVLLCLVIALLAILAALGMYFGLGPTARR
jgi:hypothetical protein